MVPEIIIVVPPLLGLKGNLEMTLAARYTYWADTNCTSPPHVCLCIYVFMCFCVSV